MAKTTSKEPEKVLLKKRNKRNVSAKTTKKKTPAKRKSPVKKKTVRARADSNPLALLCATANLLSAKKTKPAKKTKAKAKPAKKTKAKAKPAKKTKAKKSLIPKAGGLIGKRKLKAVNPKQNNRKKPIKISMARAKVEQLLIQVKLKRAMPAISTPKIGSYSHEARLIRLALHREKRRSLKFNSIKYPTRKLISSERPRSGGRFVTHKKAKGQGIENRPPVRKSNL